MERLRSTLMAGMVTKHHTAFANACTPRNDSKKGHRRWRQTLIDRFCTSAISTTMLYVSFNTMIR